MVLFNLLAINSAKGTIINQGTPAGAFNATGYARKFFFEPSKTSVFTLESFKEFSSGLGLVSLAGAIICQNNE